jgi:hypothetical protein
MDQPSRQQPVLISGIVMGVLSSIPFLNLCCCLWALGGGALAVYLLIKRSPVTPVRTGDGAVTGVYAGLVGSAVMLVVGIPLGLLFSQSALSVIQQFVNSQGDAAAREQMQRAIEQAGQQTMAAHIVSALLSWLLYAAIMIGMAALGGVIGVALFEKRKGGPPPQSYPPPGYPPNYPPPGYGPPPNQPPY